MARSPRSVPGALATAVLIASSALASAGAVGAQVDPAALPDTTLAKVVGVVDIERAIKAYPKARQLFDDLRSANTEAVAALNRENEAAKTLEMERDGFDFLTPEWIDANSRWEAARAALDARAKAQRERFTAEKDRVEALCLRELDRAIAELADKRKLLLVLRAWPLESDATVSRTLGRGTASDVLYHHSALDVTDDVVKLLQSPAYSDSPATPVSNGKRP